MKRSTFGRGSLVAVLSAALVVTSGHVATAAPEPTDEVREVIDQALIAVGDEYTAAEAAAVPAEVTATDESGSLDVGAHSIGVMPLDTENSRVLARAEGVQALSVLNEGTSTAKFELSVPENASVTPRDGGFDIAVELDGITIDLAQVAAPWAVDAAGISLPTEYSFADGVITQTVDTSEAAYPVVADPLITTGLTGTPYGPGFYVNLTGLNIKAIAAAVIAAARISPAVICLSLDKIPHPLAKTLVRGLCGLFGVETVGSILDDLAGIMRSTQYNNNTCYQTLLGSSKPFIATSMSNCR